MSRLFINFQPIRSFSLQVCLLNALLLFGEVEGSKENAKSIKMILKLLQIDIFNSDDLIVTTRSLNTSLNTSQVYQDNIQIKVSQDSLLH